VIIQLIVEPKDNDPVTPISVLDDNSIEWSDLENANSLKLLGFVIYFSTARKELLDVDYQTFRSNYHMAVDKYPVFINSLGEWVGIKQKVQSVEFLDETGNDDKQQ
jgi:hypothetical protein